MRILNTNIVKYQVVEKNVQKRNFENKVDTFEYTTTVKTPNFKAGMQDAYKKVLENPNAIQKVMSLITTAAVSLVAGAMANEEINKENSTENTENNPLMTLLLGNLFNQKQETPNLSENEETTKLKKENEELKNKISELEKVISQQKVEEEIPEINDNKVSINFPKKPGKRANEVKELESVVENITTDRDTADKLEKICKILLKDTKNKKALIKALSESLKNASNDEELKNIIDKNYNDIVEKDENPEGITKEETPKKSEHTKLGVTVVGKIDLPSGDSRHIKGNDNQEPDTNVTPKIEAAHVSADGCEGIPDIESNNQPVALDIGIGTPRKDIILNIQKLYNAFYKRSINEADKFINWSQHDGVGTTSPQLIKAEIIKEGDSYENIDTSMAEELAEIINENPHFQAFSLHGALRLIDRFVNFEDDELCPEAQVAEILNSLSSIIRKAIISEKYETYNYEETAKYGKKTYTGLRVVIDNGDNRTETERKYFGKEPLSIAICQNKFAKREAIIHTLFN